MQKGSFTTHSVSIEAAQIGITAGLAAAQTLGIKVVIAIVDPNGVLKAFARMDQTPVTSVQIAQDKAFTAAVFGLPSHEWWGQLKDKPATLAGLNKVAGFTVLEGGVPIAHHDGGVLGGVGASGAASELDRQVSQAAVDAIHKMG